MIGRRTYVVAALSALVILPATGLAQDEGKAAMPAVPPGSVAEGIKDRSFDDTEILRKQEFTGGFVLHSQGFGAILRRSKNKTYMRKRVIELEAVSMEHPKEIRSSNPWYDNTRAYSYGELSQVVVTRLGYGRHNVMYARFDKGVEVRYLYIGGLSVAWAKPIYLEIGYPSIPYQYIATERYDPERHFVDNIFGRASDLKGIDEMRLYPGIYGRFGFSFDYAKQQKNISTIETGVIIDYYVQDIPMMAKIENDPYFLTFYVSLQFGTRWYRKFSNRKNE